MKKQLAFAALILPACSISHQSAVPETGAWNQIQVSRRLWYMVCTGSCSQFDLTITNAGEVVSRTYVSDPNQATTYRYHIGPERAARFEEILGPLKARASIPAPEICLHPEISGAERELIRTDVIPLRIQWHGRAPAELAECGGSEWSSLVETLRMALREIRLWPSGDVICHLPSGEESLCTDPEVVDAPQMEGWGQKCEAGDKGTPRGPTLQVRECQWQELDSH
jgi:hypothetical protein